MFVCVYFRFQISDGECAVHWRMRKSSAGLGRNKNLKAEISSLELRRFVGGMTRACSAFVAQFLDSALKMF